MGRLISYSEKYSLKVFVKLLTVRLLRTVNAISFQRIGTCQVIAN